VQLQAGWNGFYAHFYDVNYNAGAAWADYLYTLPTYGVVVTPDGQAVQRDAYTSGHGATFTIENTGNTDNIFNLSCQATGPVTCTGLSQSSVSLLPSPSSAQVTAYYSVAGAGSGTLTVTAAGAVGGVSDPGSYNIIVVSYGVAVTPDGGSAPTRTANTGGHSESFTVTNTGTAPNTYNFSCNGAGGVTCGSVPAPVPVGGGGQAVVSMPYSVGAAGTGTLTLTATGTSASDGGSYSVPIVSYAVAVTPDGGSAPTRAANTGGHSESFTVQNAGSAQNTFSFSCSGVNGVTCGSVPTPVTLGAGAQTGVSMPYSVGAPGTGTLTLTATGTNTSDPGSYSVPIVGYGVAVTPDGGTAPSRTANTGGHSESYTVQNTGTASNTFTFSCTGATGVTCGTLPGPVVLNAGAQTNVAMSYSVGAPGTGTLTLRATGNLAEDVGTYSVPIVSYGVSVTPDGATATTRATPGSYSETFTIQNTGSASNTYTFSCTAGGGLTCGTVPGPVALNAGAQTTRPMPYTVGAPGTGTLTLTATGTYASDAGTYSVPVVSYAVAVTPDGATAAMRMPGTSGYNETFTVKNTGSASNTFSFACAGVTGVTCGTVPSPVTLSASAQTSVSMPYSVGSAGAGTLTLTASGAGGATNPGSYSIPIFAMSIVSGGSFTKDARYLLQETAVHYDDAGRIDTLRDARDKITAYQYNGGPNNAFLSKVTRVKDGTGTIDLVTDIAYNSDGYISSIKDEGGTFSYFTYDLYGRLWQVKNHAQVPVKAYGYTYSRTSANGWVYQPGNPNAVLDTTFLATGVSVISTEFLEGLGRTAQTVVRDGTDYVVTATQYDVMGRPWRAWKPYTRTTAGYDASFTTNATSAYVSYNGANAKPYAETAYTADPLARVKRVFPEYLGTSPVDTVLYTYGVDVTPKQSYAEIRDESGKKTRNYFDVFNNQVKTILGYGAAEATTTNLFYNVLGQRTKTTDPRSLNTTYLIDTRGLLTTKTSPDAGAVSSKYDQAGNLRYFQDANQAAAGQVFFTTYDFANRPLTSGQGAATFSTLDPFSSATFETTTGNWLVVRNYDAKPTNVFPWSLFWTQISPLALTNVSGRLAAVASKSNGSWQVTLFSYDVDGRVVKRYQYTHANGGITVLLALNAVDTLTLDLRGAITRRGLTVGSNIWYQWYDYDGRGLLWKVFASTSSTKPGTADVTYTYRPSGQVASRQFSGVPLVPFKDSIRELLDSIGNPASSSYPFSARYAYHKNGTVNEAQFYSGGSPATYKRYRYVFGTGSYDALNRLKSADFSHYNAGWVTSPNYDLPVINYDLNGNLTVLQRYRDTGTLVDNLTKTIASTSNRLTSVADAVGPTGEPWDAESGSFTYDANGNVLTAPGPYSITAASYDYQNLPLWVRINSDTTRYRYTEAGQRIAKQVGSGNREMYVLDGATPLSVVTVNSSGTPQSWFWNVVAGNQIVGRQPSSGDRRFYHTDLLGSTRAVTDSAVILESYDYDPWGVLMPGRTLGSGTKEGFTGKERDPETGLDYFGARYDMTALGRWAAVDPLSEKHPEWSPYNYVLDNPSALVDPDGRQEAANQRNSLAQRLQLASPSLQNSAALLERAAEVRHALAVAPQRSSPLGTGEMQAPLLDPVGLAAGLFVGPAAGAFNAVRTRIAARGTTTLFRAVQTAELQSIESSAGAFSNVAASSGGKYFATTAEGAAQYAKMAVEGFGDDAYHFVSATIRTKVLDAILKARPDATAVVDRGIQTIRLPEAFLGQLGPARVMTSVSIP
jgi:RHS repeat-associated protein